LRQRPVLMPGGWPIDANERETCARAILAAGGDLERVYDEFELGLEAYIRHLSRVPLFKLAKESPLVVVTGAVQSVVALLNFYTRLFSLTNQFDNTSWLAYLEQDKVEVFLREARGWAAVDALCGALYAWYLSPMPVLVVSQTSQLDQLGSTLADLDHSPASGVVAVPAVAGAIRQHEPLPAKQPSPAHFPDRKAASSLSSNSLARLTLDSRAVESTSPRRTTPPPSNPRIRRNTG